MGLRLLAAALLAATAHGACQACMKYLDLTWGGRGPHACNDTWAAKQGYDACPPPETCDFALAQQGDDTCKHMYPAAAGGAEQFEPESGTARCQESGCCNSTRDSKEAKQYGNKTCPPQILSFEQGMYLERTCSENEDLCPQPADPEPAFELGARLAPDTVNSGRDWVDKHTYADANQVSRTLCFTGAGNYARQQAYCDLECKANQKTRKAVAKASGRDDDGYNEDCRGPWYCSKMEVCHLFHDKTVNDEDKKGPKRKCMTVRSCANHSQCFPTDSDQERMRISSNAFTIRPRKVDDGYSESKSALGTQIRDHGFTMQYGGMEHTTRCCVNRNNFRPTIDTPCNSGVRARLSLSVAVVALAWWR